MLQRSEHRSSSGQALRCLWLAVSGHGHGHLVQVTPLVRQLQTRFPSMRLCVQSSLPPSLLQTMFGASIDVHDEPADVGMIMDGPLTVLAEQSHQAYLAFHDEWDKRLARQVALYEAAQPDLIIGDIPYLPLAAARACAIPAVAVCSLNWADIHAHYCQHLHGADTVSAWIRQHYAAADVFLRPTPAMPMNTLDNTRAVGPLIAVGEVRRDELVDSLSVSSDARVVLVTLGGIAGQVDVTRWPSFNETVFLVPEAWRQALTEQGTRLPAGFATIESTGLPMADLFASCDAMITKPGYGAFAGAACVGLPVLYAERGDWPEEPVLTEWLHRVGRAMMISRTELQCGEFGRQLDELLAQAAKPTVAATGAGEALAIIEELIGTVPG